MQLDAHEFELYSRQIKLPEIGENGQLKLKNSSVLCVGAGGLGAPLLQYLAAAGVGRIGIIDDDVVDISNLQRQIIYSRDQVGMLKVKAARSRIREINPDVHVEIFSHQFSHQCADIVNQYDVIADCSDNLMTRYVTNASCLQFDKPFVFAGISRYQGQCMMFTLHDGPCFHCIFPEEVMLETLPDCNTAGVIGVLPGILGLLQTNLILQYLLQLTNVNNNQFYLFDMLTMSLQNIKTHKNVDCSVCNGEGEMRLNFISSTELTTFISQNKPFILLDVRSLDEHHHFNIGGACIPLDELRDKASELRSDKPVIVYCQTGRRSAAAALILRELGFNSRSLFGGIVSMKSCGMI